MASISLEGKLCSVILFWPKLVNILAPSDETELHEEIVVGKMMPKHKNFHTSNYFPGTQNFEMKEF